MYDALTECLSKKAKNAFETDDLFISPIVVLELFNLKEVNRLNPTPYQVISTLTDRLDLQVSSPNLNLIVYAAIKISWTRDLFDRIITAEAAMNNAPLVTADRVISKNYSGVVW